MPGGVEARLPTHCDTAWKVSSPTWALGSHRRKSMCQQMGVAEGGGRLGGRTAAATLPLSQQPLKQALPRSMSGQAKTHLQL